MTAEASRSPLRERPWWLRVRYTPLGDLIRGRVTARLDLKGMIAASDLPDPLPQTIHTVTRKTRLWRREKLDIARELIDHFRDGLAVGRSAEELIASFGDANQAARLMRRAKRRARPLAWHVGHRAAQAVGLMFGAVLLLYVGLLIRFQFLRPNIAWNYTAEINAEALAVPEEDRAWPLYREALSRLRKPAEGLDWNELIAARPGDESWPAMAAYLDDHGDVLRLLRKAAEKPRLGFYYGNADDYRSPLEDSLISYPIMWPPESENPMVMSMSLGHIQYLRTLATVLRSDALRAAEAGDSSTVYADITAQLALAEHARDTTPSLVTDLMAFALFVMPLWTLDEILIEHRDALSDKQLQELAHRIGGTFGGGRFEMRLEGDRAFFRDLCQRIYSDDGHGDGVLTADGVRLLSEFEFPHLLGLLAFDARHVSRNWQDDAALHLIGSGASAMFASRREMTELADSLMNDAEAQMRKPLWEQTEFEADRRIEELASSPLDNLRYLPVVELFPGMSSVYLAGERMTQQRDATLVAIALELYRRENGDWPTELEQLTPALLPEVPPDRFDGEPLRYRLVKGRPVLYSLGIDRDDDGGQMASEGNEIVDRWTLVPLVESSNVVVPDGDWILWPPAEEEGGGGAISP